MGEECGDTYVHAVSSKFEVLAAASTLACTCKTSCVVCVLLVIYVKVPSIRTVHMYVLYCVNIL